MGHLEPFTQSLHCEVEEEGGGGTEKTHRKQNSRKSTYKDMMEIVSYLKAALSPFPLSPTFSGSNSLI